MATQPAEGATDTKSEGLQTILEIRLTETTRVIPLVAQRTTLGIQPVAVTKLLPHKIRSAISNSEHCGILIDADDFCALLRSGSTEFWVVGGEEGANPIAHLQHVFSV